MRPVGWPALAAVTLAAPALRLPVSGAQQLVSVDGTVYIRLARALFSDAQFETVQPPGYPALIAIFHTVIRDWVAAAKAVDLVSGVLLVPLVWILARRYVPSWRWCLFPALAVALLPLFVRYSVTTMSEMPYMVLVTAMFLAVPRRPFTGGLLGGLAYLVRPEGLIVAAALALAGVLRAPRWGLRLGLGAAVIAGGFVLQQGLATGSWTLSAKTVNVGGTSWMDNEPAPGDTARAFDARVREYGQNSLRAYPARLAGHVRQLVRHGGYVVPLVGLAGLATPAAPLAAGVLPLAVTPAFSLPAHPRFILPYLPFLFILATAFLARRPRFAMPLLGLCLLGVAASAYTERRAYTLNEDGTFPALVKAGEWLRQYVTEGTVVYDRKPYTAFYAGAEYRAIPMGSYDEILDAIVAAEGDYLVLGQAVIDFFRPMLLPLIMDKGYVTNDPRLAPVYLDTQYVNRRTMIFRVVRPGGPAPNPEEAHLKPRLAEITHQEDHFPHGMLALRAGRWQVAAGEFEYVLRRDPENADALNNRAWALYKANVGALGVAEENARKAVSIQPENADYWDTLVAILQAAEKTEEAAEAEATLRRLTGDAP